MKGNFKLHSQFNPSLFFSRWVRGICEAIRPLETLDVEGLVRLWAHEALRLFQDRLVEEEERVWTNTNIDDVALKHFPNIDKEKVSLLFLIWGVVFPLPHPSWSLVFFRRG